MIQPEFDPGILAKTIKQGERTIWDPSDDIRYLITQEVLRYCVAAGIHLNFDDVADREMIAILCTIFTQGLEIGWQYATDDSDRPTRA